MSSCAQRILTLLCCLIMIFAFSVPFSAGAASDPQEKIVKVGWYPSDMFQIGSSDAESKSGYSYEYLKKISQYNGWKYQFIYGEWADLFDMLKKGEIDLMACVSKTPEREEYLSFPDYIMGRETYSIYQHSDSPSMDVSDLSTFYGKKIGAVKDNLMTSSLEQWAAEKNADLNIVYYDGMTERDRAFGSGEIDGIVATDYNVLNNTGYTIVTKVGESDYYIAVAKGRDDLLSELNSALGIMDEVDPYFIQNLQSENYYTTIADTIMTVQEQEWLNSHDTLSLGFLTGYLPYSALDEADRTTGLITDVMSAIVSDLGLDGRLKVEYRPYSNYGKMISALQSGEVDAVFPVGTRWSTDQENVDETSSVVTAGMELICQDQYTPVGKQRFAVNRNNRLQKDYTEENFHKAEILEFDTAEACIEAVYQGDADYTILDGLRVGILQSSDKYRRLKIIQLQKSDARCIGVKHGNTALLLILNRGLKTIGSDFGINAGYAYMATAQNVSFSEFIRNNMQAVLLIIGIFAAVVTLIIAVYVRRINHVRKGTQLQLERNAELTRQLEKQIQETTALNGQLVENQTKLEEASAEQKTQLSEIRHLNADIRNRMGIIQSVIKLYFAAYYIDIPADTYTELSSIENIRQHGFAPNGNAQESLFRMCAVLIRPEFQDAMREFVDLSTLNSRLRDADSVTLQYIGNSTGWSQAYFIAGDREKDGTLKTVIWCARTIHEEKEKESEAIKQISEYNDAMANAGYGMWHIILKEGVAPRMQVNAKMAELLGIAGQDLSEEELYSAWYDQIVPDAIPSVQASVSEMMAGHFSENTYQWVHPAKGVIYVRCGGTAVMLEDGTNVLSGYHADVTDLVQKEQARKAKLEKLNENLARQLNVIGGLSNAYFCTYSADLNTGEFREEKQIAGIHEMLKDCHTIEEAFSRFISLGVVPEDRERMGKFTDIRTLPERMKEADVISLEYRGRITQAWNRASWIAARRDENGRVYGVLYVVEEINGIVLERKRQEDELKKARDQAEAANKAKTSFLFNMSHDIRTPMNAIIGFTELLKKHKHEPDKVDDYINKIQSSSDFLLSLINNVLEMARIESGKTTLDESVFKVGEISDEITTVYADLMKKKNITFSHSVQSHTKYIYGDTVKLREIWLNIISNAYKYTPEGGTVSLSTVELPSDKEGYALMRTTFSDTGIGMSKEFLKVIFEEFTREHNSTESQVQGTGLGMPIVKKLVDLMGGTITVESELGKGSVFTVTLMNRIGSDPKNEAAESLQNDEKEAGRFEGKRILLAEDNDLNAEIAEEILSEAGFEVERAADGVICVDMLQKAPCSYYDLILMDIQMPNMDGYKATQIIRAMNDSSRNQIPIIAMTANAFDEDKKNALAAGMNGHLAKPINVSELMKTLAGIIG